MHEYRPASLDGLALACALDALRAGLLGDAKSMGDGAISDIGEFLLSDSHCGDPCWGGDMVISLTIQASRDMASAWPIMLLVLETGVNLARSPKTPLHANVSVRSLTVVLVP